MVLRELTPKPKRIRYRTLVILIQVLDTFVNDIPRRFFIHDKLVVKMPVG